MSNYSVALTSIATGPLVARMLGPARRGQYAVGLTTVLFAASMTALGLVTVLNGRPSAYDRDTLWFATKPWRRFSLSLGVGLAFPASLICHATGLSLVPILALALISAVANPYTTLTVACLTATASYRSLFWWRGCSSVAPILGLVTLKVGGVQPSTIQILYLYILSAHIPALEQSLRRGYRARRTAVRSVREIIKRDTPPAALYSVLTLGNARLDQVLLSASLTNGQIGLYAVAVNYGGAVQPFAMTLSSVLMRDTVRRTSSRGLMFRISITFICSAVLFFGARSLVPALFGGGFGPAVNAAYLLCLAGFIQAVGLLVAGQLVALGAARKTVFGGVAAFAFIPLCIPLSTRYGISGAAAVSVFCYSIDGIWQIYQYRRVTNRLRTAG